ncbi:MAG: BTAD domain-containing putative transcriptional regulator [Solirubrobacterales bacterium]
MLRISVLGPVEVSRDGEPLAIPGGKTTELLVRLAVEAGLYVRTERLVEDLWAEGAAGTSRNTLQSKVSRLRRAFGDPGAIVAGEGCYRLAVDPACVDSLAVLGDAAAAARILEEGDHRAAAERSEAALGMFRGELLQSAGDGEWVTQHRGRLEEAQLKLIETGFSARLRLGEAGETIGGLEAAVAEHPYQEGLWELLITALYRTGRQAEALEAYQRVRVRLLDDLGLAPGPRLQRLELQVLAHDPDLEAGVTSPSPGTDEVAGNLPVLSSRLVGRDDETAAVEELVENERLVEIVGPGGVGKTALAIAAGRLLAATEPGSGGVWLVRLEAVRTADEILDALIAALNVAGGEPALIERLRAGPSVVILDNCEHVHEAVAALALRLLETTSELRLLCTSQVALGIDGESVLELAPLGLPEAVELFGLRSIARRGGRPVAEPGEEVEELCRSLDGLPLAIELAAARTKTLSVGEIGRRLDDRFGILADPTSSKPERRRALRATIGWSYELLFPDDKRGLWSLSAFAGGGRLAAVESVMEALDVPAPAAIDVIERLTSRSLVLVDEDPETERRFRLLDSIRAFAREAVAAAGLGDRAAAAHAAWLARAAESSTAGVRSARQAEYLAFARAERANVDAALSWCVEHDPLLALRIVNGFGWAWIVLGDSRGAQRVLTALGAAAEEATAPERANALLLASWLEASTDQLELAREHVDAARRFAEEAGEAELEARACYHLAYVVSHHGDFGAALELTDRCTALYEGFDRPWDQAANALFAARAAISAGDRERSVRARDQVEYWLRIVEDPWLHVRRDAMLGELARVEHRFDDAVLHIGRAAEVSDRLGFRQTEAYQLSSLGRAQCQAGDYEAGAATIALAIEKAEGTGDSRLAALARVHLGRVLRALGRTSEAREALAAADEWHRGAGGGEQAALGACLLAALDAADGAEGAVPRLEAILADARRDDDAPVEVFALDALARAAAGAGDREASRRFGSAADLRMEAAAHFVSELDRVDAPPRDGARHAG